MEKFYLLKSISSHKILQPQDRPDLHNWLIVTPTIALTPRSLTCRGNPLSDNRSQTLRENTTMRDRTLNHLLLIDIAALTRDRDLVFPIPFFLKLEFFADFL
jgi:hypothetical protein